MPILRCLAPLLIFTAVAARADEPAEAPANTSIDTAVDTAAIFDPIVVFPNDDPFDDSMQRLRKAFEDPYCRGCPPEIRAYHKSVYEQLGGIVSFFTGLGAEPPQMTPAQRVEHRIRNEWRLAGRGPEVR